MKLKDRLEELEEEVRYGKQKRDTEKKKKEFGYPFSWKSKIKRSSKLKDKVLVWYLNSHGIIEPPKLVPVYAGNVIIIKDKSHEFDPRALCNVKMGVKLYKALLIREIDRKPWCNLDWNRIKKRGDTTRNDEILLKMLRLAMVEKVKKATTNVIWWIIGLGGGALVLYYLFAG